MATDPRKNQGDAPPATGEALRAPKVTMLRANAAPRAAPRPEGGAVLPPGPGMATLLPDVDVRSLTLTSFDGAAKSMDLRDFKKHVVRVRQKPEGEYVLEPLSPRGKPTSSMPLTRQAGKDLVEVMHLALVQAKGNSLQADNLGGARDFLDALAKAAEVTLSDAGQALPRAESAPAKDEGGFANPVKPWAGFSGTKVESRAPTERALGTATSSTSAIGKAAPGLDVDSLVVRSVDPTKSYVEMEDRAGNWLFLRQSKFTPPPQFEFGFTPAEGSLEKTPVRAELARELAHTLPEALMRNQDGWDDVRLKSVRVMINALLKVM